MIIQDTVTGLSGSGGTFTVVDPNNVPPSVQISGPSRLAMAYDSSRKESALTSTFKVVVSSGSRSTNIMKNGAFSTYVKTHTNIYSYGASQYPQPSGTIDDGQGNYIISASSSATFTVTTTFNPQNMFAGSYYGILDSVHIGDWSSGQSISVPSPNTTNSIIVIGELSPYIDSITPDPTASNGVISINGSRFAIAPKINTIYVYSKNSPANAIFSAQSTDGLNLKLLTNLTPGDYYIQVLNQDTGLSNNMWLTLTSSTPQYPDITISANPNKVVQGQKSTLSWNALNASYCSGIGWGSASMPTNSSAMIFVKSTRSYVISCANTIPGQGSLISYATTTVSLDAVEISTSSVSSSTAQMESRSRNNGSSMYVGQSSSPSPSVSVSESPSPSVSSSPSPSPSGSSDENGSSPTPVPTPSTTQTPPITPPVQNPVPQKSPTPSPAPAPSSGPESIIPMTSNLTGVIWNSLKWLILRK